MKAKFIHESIQESKMDEAYEPKDLARVKDFAKKSGGDTQKEIALAHQMAHAITKVEKAIGRAEAAAEVYGPDHDVVKVFYDRAKELGYEGDVPGERLERGPVLGSQLTPYNKDAAQVKFRQGHILPLGNVDLRSGESQIFNVYDTWGDYDTTVEVWVNTEDTNSNVIQMILNKGVEQKSTSILRPKSNDELKTALRTLTFRAIFTSGSKPLFNIGDKASFVHDQNGRYLGTWVMVDYVPLKYMTELILPYKGKMKGYVYK